MLVLREGLHFPALELHGTDHLVAIEGGDATQRAALSRDLRGRLAKMPEFAAVQNGGAIPDTFNYQVISEPEDKQVGTLDEDYAVESMPGDVFVLGSTSWRIRRIYDGAVRVEKSEDKDTSTTAPTNAS